MDAGLGAVVGEKGWLDGASFNTAMSGGVSIVFSGAGTLCDTPLSEVVGVGGGGTGLDTGPGLVFSIGLVGWVALLHAGLVLQLSIKVRIPWTYANAITCRYVRKL